ncbi:MAG: hypothetical protein GY906_26460, partial [bacterium]|nr:hypothetical protein [bacterium]
MVMDRKSAAAELKHIAKLLELHGSNVYRVRAFANASRAIARFEGDLDAALRSGAISDMRGIGKSTLQVLQELALGNQPSVLADLLQDTPRGLLQVLELSGLGPKRVRELWQGLGVTNIGEVEYACRENRLIDLKGFGEKTQLKLLDAIEFHKQTRERRLLPDALTVAERIRNELLEAKGIDQVVIAGEIRRCCETVGKIAMVVVAAGPQFVAGALNGTVEGVENDDGETFIGRVEGSFPCVVRVASESTIGAALLWETGSQTHLEALGLKLK